MRTFFISALIILALNSFAGDTLRFHRQISGYAVHQVLSLDSTNIQQISFNGAQYEMKSPQVPLYAERIPLDDLTQVGEVLVENAVFGIPDRDISFLTELVNLTEDIVPSWGISHDRGKPYAIIGLLPFRINPYNGLVENLLSFDIAVVTSETVREGGRERFEYAENSVLSSGSWYKVTVREDRIYKLTFADLQELGMNPASLDPRNIRLYGNPGGMLPEPLNDMRPDDLQEISILVSGEEDGRFDQGDFILFYGQSPHRWQYDEGAQVFNHQQHLYSNKTAYFLTASLGPGKRIMPEPSTSLQPTASVTSFTDYAHHERDLFNLINAGRVWYGEKFDIKTTYDTTYSFPDLDPSGEAYFKAYVAAKSSVSSTFRFYNGNEQILTGSVNGIPPTSDTFARNYIGSAKFFPASSDVSIRVEYQKPTSSSTGWLNYFELNVVRNLRFSGDQMSFRSPQAIGSGSVAEFMLSNAGSEVRVWDVTDPVNARQILTTANGNDQSFRLPHETLREFIAWKGSSFGSPELSGPVENQNLRGLKVPDMVIISHSSFLSEAERLAAFHREMDKMTVEVVEIQKIYNEFSTGIQDATAIRNMMKMLWDRSTEGNEFRYLLLFGDASFDYKDRIQGNTNFVPTWQAEESLTIVYSIASDDYFGFLDGPGDNLLDIGIGRLPVETPEQATQMVDKIIHYATNSRVVMQDWRNVITFVADDEDQNLHFNQAEEMAVFLDTNYGAYNIDKIYVDAFPQLATAGGQRTPEDNKAINNSIAKGTLIMNYTGHGGEVGWGHERFLEISDINSWRNEDMLPIFITATCEFSRYDDPERLSAGEMVFRNPQGGAIAMFTTARATFGGSNFNLNQALFDIMFEKVDGENYRFGDLIRISKNKNGVVDNDKKFILLGDPALKLAFPEYTVHVDSVNGFSVTQEPDTLRALSKVQVSGKVVDEEGILMEGYNGTLHSIVFDKPSTIKTLNTDETSRPAEFDL
jgi:hypothetical protein